MDDESKLASEKYDPTEDAREIGRALERLLGPVISRSAEPEITCFVELTLPVLLMRVFKKAEGVYVGRMLH